jgi:hypothetical protein
MKNLNPFHRELMAVAVWIILLMTAVCVANKYDHAPVQSDTDRMKVEHRGE